MNTVLKWFAIGWGALAVLVNIASMAMIVAVQGPWQGWRVISEIWNPFNLWNLGAELVLFSPAIVAHYWLQRRSGRT